MNKKKLFSFIIVLHYHYKFVMIQDRCKAGCWLFFCFDAKIPQQIKFTLPNANANAHNRKPVTFLKRKKKRKKKKKKGTVKKRITHVWPDTIYTRTAHLKNWTVNVKPTRGALNPTFHVREEPRNSVTHTGRNTQNLKPKPVTDRHVILPNPV